MAIDTNVMLRFSVDVDLLWGAQACTLIATALVFVADTVLLDTEWVLLVRQHKTCRNPPLIPGVAVIDPAVDVEGLASDEGDLGFVDSLLRRVSRHRAARDFRDPPVGTADCWSAEQLIAPRVQL